MTSIHPRNQFKNKSKKNTCVPSKKGGGKTLQKQRKRLDIRRASWAALPDAVKPAYREPGSMNPDRSR